MAIKFDRSKVIAKEPVISYFDRFWMHLTTDAEYFSSPTRWKLFKAFLYNRSTPKRRAALAKANEDFLGG